MSTVHIPAALRRLTGGKDRVEATGETVGELIQDLAERFPGLAAELVVDGELSPHMAVSVDDELSSAGLLEPVQETSDVHFVPPLGGG